MLFSSIPFLYYFLPCVFILYFISPKTMKNGVLFLASLVFYAWGEPKNIFILFITIFIGYVFGILIEKQKERPLQKVFLGLSVTLLVGMFLYFKYTNFFIINLNAITKASLPLKEILLPLGISFYTFQVLSYLIDVYRGSICAQKSFLLLGTYISMFPQLVAGPIVRYSDIEAQLKNRDFTMEQTAQGIKRFLIGLSKKVLFADSFGALVSFLQSSSENSLLSFWLQAVAFTLQIYFDFSGYSDMAIGLGKILGFTFPENFNYPYISKSITEFWRRWHISLGTWFRDYIYIPLGGNRVPFYKWLRNILIVWLFTGFWHGASWNFILWGLFYALLLLFEKLFFHKILEKTKVINHLYVLLAIIVGFVIFENESLTEIVFKLQGMFGLTNAPLTSKEAVFAFKNYAVLLLFGIVGSTPSVSILYKKLENNAFISKALIILEPIFYLALLILVTAYLVDSSFHPFLYFRF